jgi:hypothetical protein
MADRIKVYNLEQGGNQLVKSAQHMADNEFESSQNAEFGDNKSGGGIETRAGMAKFNTVAMSGAISGFIDAPLIDLRPFGFDRTSAELSSSQLDTLNATPVPFIPAPGVGNVIMPIIAKVRLIRSGASAWTAAPQLQIVFAGETVNLLQALSIDGLTQAAASIDKFYSLLRANSFTGTSGKRYDNQGLNLRFSADTNPGSPATLAVDVLYHIIRGLY